MFFKIQQPGNAKKTTNNFHSICTSNLSHLQTTCADKTWKSWLCKVAVIFVCIHTHARTLTCEGMTMMLWSIKWAHICRKSLRLKRRQGLSLINFKCNRLAVLIVLEIRAASLYSALCQPVERNPSNTFAPEWECLLWAVVHKLCQLAVHGCSRTSSTGILFQSPEDTPTLLCGQTLGPPRPAPCRWQVFFPCRWRAKARISPKMFVLLIGTMWPGCSLPQGVFSLQICASALYIFFF